MLIRFEAARNVRNVPANCGAIPFIGVEALSRKVSTHPIPLGTVEFMADQG